MPTNSPQPRRRSPVLGAGQRRGPAGRQSEPARRSRAVDGRRAGCTRSPPGPRSAENVQFLEVVHPRGSPVHRGSGTVPDRARSRPAAAAWARNRSRPVGSSASPVTVRARFPGCTPGAGPVESPGKSLARSRPGGGHASAAVSRRRPEKPGEKSGIQLSCRGAVRAVFVAVFDHCPNSSQYAATAIGCQAEEGLQNGHGSAE